MNKRGLRPQLECLEGKALQSSGMLLAHRSSALQAGANRSGTALVATLTTDRRVYHSGQSVVMTLKETNRSNQSVSIAVGPSVGGFYVTQHGSTVWSSNGGIQPLFVIQQVIPPHGSITFSATWDCQSTGVSAAHPSGVFQVHSQVVGAHPVVIRLQPDRLVTASRLASG